MCSFHEELGLLEQDALIEPGVWTLDEIKEQGKRRGTCPYFAIRRMVGRADATLVHLQAER